VFAVGRGKRITGQPRLVNRHAYEDDSDGR
jgi:hypothetical protein